MKDISQKLADSLEQLQQLQESGVVAIQSKELSRVHRERLLKHGFIREVIRGWYIPTMPDEKPGDSTSWYTSFWDFCGAYLSERFDNSWCLSPEQSISLHIGDRTVPQQLLVRSPKGNNKPTAFLHHTSIFDVRLNMPDTEQIEKLDGLNVYSLAAALVYSSANQFQNAPIQMRTALSMVTDASDVLSVLLAGNHSVIAGRLAGAFRNIGRDLIANNILKGMQAADFKVQENDPFAEKVQVSFGRRDVSPYVNRIRLMWAQLRESVIAHFPEQIQQNVDIETYMAEVEDKYLTDAYHSLSIEGYRVTCELIELVRSGNWQAEGSGESKKHLDAMAAKGYWDAFQEVKKAVLAVLEGKNPGDVLEQTHSDWYLALFGPSVAAGIIQQSDLAGYRSGPVYIRQSMHTPPDRGAVRDMMPTLFDLLAEEENAAVRVVLGHFIFVYIHPYFDGNGRIGRFIMNLMMASGGYPWTIVPVTRREEYMQALEAASVKQDIVPFTKFLASLL
ncbi:cell filamentation protein Fic [Aliidiomarina taiwanensis]|uniref:Cell filamentation protein Fic n=1 Tax=Aliidiomarina taiwanensis TaxID=946228 RepID=A0A432X1I7_9GAMM|nr:Fic family protein [Aliidiomarina taiwanensis]RUO40146.1 cell filamentation protein Fic [Aliidiomarina taiwanensis]